ncbi:MAG TPA: cupin domain-containing protein [Lacunisphaera sp.]|nr:cupin domain-containing protein [Lacunisphaera sp.]
MKIPQPLLFALTAAVAFAAGAAADRAAQPAPLESCIIRRAEVKKSGGDWGTIRVYTRDTTTTTGTDSMLTAELEFLPGKRLQPPHQHPNEEFQYVISGTGTWHLNGKDIPLEPGDLMYAKPGDLHGIANTGTEPLRFFVVKWISRRPEAR